MQHGFLASKKNVIILVVVAVAVVLMVVSYYMKKQRLEKQTALGAQIEVVMDDVVLPKDENKFIARAATKRAVVADMTTPLQLPGGPIEVNVRAFDRAYPLFGAMKLDRGRFKKVFTEDIKNKSFGVAASAAFLGQSGMKMGDTFMVQGITYQIRGIVESLPDESGSRLVQTPLLLITHKAMRGSGMFKYASRRQMLYRISSNKVSAARFEREFRQSFPNSVAKINRWDK